MNIYSIYVNPQKKDNNFILIKQGFSLFATLLGAPWAVYHKMWLPLIITMIFNIIVMNLESDLAYIGQIFIMLIFAFYSSDIREYDLEQKEYRLEDVILAKSEIEAELKFLQRQKEDDYV
jgi:hypothetical protein